MKKILLTFSGIAAAAIFLNSCSSDNNYEDATGGPGNSDSFVGTTVSFNPTLLFNAGNQLTYINNDNSGQFPFAPASSPQIGTYSYTTSPDFRSGTLEISVPGLAGGFTRTIGVTDFINVKGKVRGFTLNFTPEGPFVATVTRGNIPAAGPPKGDGNAGGGGSGGGGNINDFIFQEDGNIEGGTTFSKANISTVFGGFFGGGAFTFSPLLVNPVGTEQTFTIAANGNIEFPGVDRRGLGGSYTLSIPYQGNTDGILSYSGFDSESGGTLLVTFDTVDTNVLTVRWDDNTFSDYEQQSFN